MSENELRHLVESVEKMDRSRKRCVGFDENGKAFDCSNPPGTPWTPVWCSDCDERRRTKLTEQFEALAAGVVATGDDHER